MQIDYQTPQYHVAMRDGLPSAIRPTLLEETETDWRQHPRYAGKARFFMNIHRNLLDGADSLHGALEQMLDLPTGDLGAAIRRSNLTDGATGLINFAHGHHEIEDHGYFPQFVRLYPQLERAMNLMDGDHKVLDEALHGAEHALDEIANSGASRDRIAGLYTHSAALKKVMHRHITDEEEVIIPIFLRHG